jgi:hypothetical protein
VINLVRSFLPVQNFQGDGDYECKRSWVVRAVQKLIYSAKRDWVEVRTTPKRSMVLCFLTGNCLLESRMTSVVPDQFSSDLWLCDPAFGYPDLCPHTR